MHDSDRDGFTNGMELGDPTGAWRVGDPAPGRVLSLSNPGVFSSIPVNSRHRSDFNADGKVDYCGLFESFAAAFGRSRGDPEFNQVFDLNGDDTINFQDFVSFAGDFSAGE